MDRGTGWAGPGRAGTTIKCGRAERRKWRKLEDLPRQLACRPVGRRAGPPAPKTRPKIDSIGCICRDSGPARPMCHPSGGPIGPRHWRQCAFSREAAEVIHTIVLRLEGPRSHTCTRRRAPNLRPVFRTAPATSLASWDGRRIGHCPPCHLRRHHSFRPGSAPASRLPFARPQKQEKILCALWILFVH